MKIRLIPISIRKKSSIFPILLLLAIIAGYLVYANSQQTKIIKFSYEIETNKTGHQLWSFLAESFHDSTKHESWPNNLIELKINDALKQGSPLKATYKLFFLKSEQDYFISDLKTSTAISYETGKKHPLKGGSTFTILPKGRKSILKWKGRYQYQGLSPSAWYFKHYFVPRLKKELRSNLNQK